MPAAVSSVRASASPSAQSTVPIPQPGQRDGPSFRDELDRAQNEGSAPDGNGKDGAKADSAAPTDGDVEQAPATAKPGSAGKVPAKKRSAQAAKGDPVALKKGTEKNSAKTDPETDSDPSDGDNGQQREGASGRKQKKAPADADGTAAAGATATSPGAATAAQGSALLAGNGLETKQSTDSTSSHDGSVTSAVAEDAAKTEEIPEPDEPSQSAASSASRTGHSAKGRGGDATKDDGDAQSASAADVAAGIQAIATADDAIDSDAGATSASLDSGSTTPIAKASSKTLGDALVNGLPQDNPADRRSPIAAIASAKDATQTPPETQFADANRSQIVSGITGKLLPDGGSMQLTLDPANLGPLQVRVEMKNGVMSASFETSNDQASKLLSHSLGDLKSALEAQGVTVEKLHVAQSSKQQSSSGDSHQGASDKGQNAASQQEQQRKEMMRRMWRKLMKGQDPLDLVA